jgi:hypothetical protein
MIGGAMWYYLVWNASPASVLGFEGGLSMVKGWI